MESEQAVNNKIVQDSMDRKQTTGWLRQCPKAMNCHLKEKSNVQTDNAIRSFVEMNTWMF